MILENLYEYFIRLFHQILRSLHQASCISEETLEDMEDKIIEEDIEMIDIMNIIEAGTGQEKGHLQEIIVVTEIEAQVIVDLGLVPELVQIEIGLDVTIVESMTIS